VLKFSFEQSLQALRAFVEVCFVWAGPVGVSSTWVGSAGAGAGAGRAPVISRSGRFVACIGILPRIVFIVGEGGGGLISGLGDRLVAALVAAVALVPRVRTAFSCSLLGLTTRPFAVAGRAAYAAWSAWCGPW